MYKQHSTYLGALQRWTPARDADTDTVAAHIKLREQQLKDRRITDGQKAELSTTKMIAEAATEVLGPELAEEVVLEWRSGSGAAHGLSWHLFGTPGTEQVSVADRHGRARRFKRAVPSSGWRTAICRRSDCSNMDGNFCAGGGREVSAAGAGVSAWFVHFVRV
jgi:hypothetical protein